MNIIYDSVLFCCHHNYYEMLVCLFVFFFFAFLGEENKFMLLYTMNHEKSNTGLNVIFVYLKKNYLTAI